MSSELSQADINSSKGLFSPQKQTAERSCPPKKWFGTKTQLAVLCGRDRPVLMESFQPSHAFGSSYVSNQSTVTESNRIGPRRVYVHSSCDIVLNEAHHPGRTCSSAAHCSSEDTRKSFWHRSKDNTFCQYQTSSSLSLTGTSLSNIADNVFKSIQKSMSASFEISFSNRIHKSAKKLRCTESDSQVLAQWVTKAILQGVWKAEENMTIPENFAEHVKPSGDVCLCASVEDGVVKLYVMFLCTGIGSCQNLSEIPESLFDRCHMAVSGPHGSNQYSHRKLLETISVPIFKRAPTSCANGGPVSASPCFFCQESDESEVFTTCGDTFDGQEGVSEEEEQLDRNAEALYTAQSYLADNFCVMRKLQEEERYHQKAVKKLADEVCEVDAEIERLTAQLELSQRKEKLLHPSADTRMKPKARRLPTFADRRLPNFEDLAGNKRPAAWERAAFTL